MRKMLNLVPLGLLSAAPARAAADGAAGAAPAPACSWPQMTALCGNTRAAKGQCITCVLQHVALGACQAVQIEGFCSGGAGPADDWRFAAAYPKQYVAHALGEGEAISIDGALDEAAWAAVEWAGGFVDIAQPVFPALEVPEAYQTRVKVRWDDDYLYVGAEISEPLVWGNVTGHNDGLTHGKAPWWNNDFEVFVDVAGSTHFSINDGAGLGHEDDIVVLSMRCFLNADPAACSTLWTGLDKVVKLAAYEHVGDPPHTGVLFSSLAV